MALLDNFNRANESPLASPWVQSIYSNDAVLYLVSNGMKRPAGGWGSAYKGDQSFGPDFRVDVTIQAIDAGAGLEISGPITSGDTTQPNFYFVHIDGSDAVDTWQLWKSVTGTQSSIGATATKAGGIVAGSEIRLEKIGTTIKAYYRAVAGTGGWTEVFSRTDSSLNLTGPVGCLMQNATWSVDAIAAETVSSGPTLTPITLAATMTLTPALRRKEFESVAALLAANPALSKRTRVLEEITVPMIAGIGMRLVIQRALPATMTLTPVLAKLNARTLTVALATNPALVRQAWHALTIPATVTLAPELAKRVLARRTIEAAVTLVPALGVRKTALRSLDASTTLSAALTRRLYKQIDATVPVTLSMTLESLVAIELAAALVATAALDMDKKLYRTLAVSSTLAPAFQRVVTRQLAATVALAPEMRRKIIEQLDVVATLAPGLSRRDQVTLACSMVLTAAMAVGNASIPINLAATMNFLVDLDVEKLFFEGELGTGVEPGALTGALMDAGSMVGAGMETAKMTKAR